MLNTINITMNYLFDHTKQITYKHFYLRYILYYIYLRCLHSLTTLY